MDIQNTIGSPQRRIPINSVYDANASTDGINQDVYGDNPETNLIIQSRQPRQPRYIRLRKLVGASPNMKDGILISGSITLFSFIILTMWGLIGFITLILTGNNVLLSSPSLYGLFTVGFITLIFSLVTLIQEYFSKK